MPLREAEEQDALLGGEGAGGGSGCGRRGWEESFHAPKVRARAAGREDRTGQDRTGTRAVASWTRPGDPHHPPRKARADGLQPPSDCPRRLDLGLTQDEAAAAAGVDVRTWRRYESGEVNDPGPGSASATPAGGASSSAWRRAGNRRGGAARRRPSAPLPLRRRLPRRSAWMACHAHPSHGHRTSSARPRARCPARAPERAPRARALSRWSRWGGPEEPPSSSASSPSSAKGPKTAESRVEPVRRPRVEAFLDRALAYFAGQSAAAPGQRLDALTGRSASAAPLVLDGLEVAQGAGRGGRRWDESRTPRCAASYERRPAGWGGPGGRDLARGAHRPRGPEGHPASAPCASTPSPRPRAWSCWAAGGSRAAPASSRRCSIGWAATRSRWP